MTIQADTPSTSMTQNDWFLYIIRCSNGQLYTGITKDIERRFQEHQAGGAKAAKFLRGKTPLTMVYHENVGDHSQALKREIAVKKLSRQQKLALIESSQNDVKKNYMT